MAMGKGLASEERHPTSGWRQETNLYCCETQFPDNSLSLVVVSPLVCFRCSPGYILLMDGYCLSSVDGVNREEKHEQEATNNLLERIHPVMPNTSWGRVS